MNKSVIVALAAFAVMNSVRSTSSSELINKVKSNTLKKLLNENKDAIDGSLDKLEEKCSGVSEKLKSALVSFQECDDRSDDSLTICAAVQRYTLNCTAPLLQVADDCLPAAAKGLPSLGVKSLLSVADFLCKQTGESIFELGNPCVVQEDDECEDKIKALVEKYHDKFPTKSEVCAAAIELKSCVQARVQTACKNQKTKDVFTGILAAVVAPCSQINEL